MLPFVVTVISVKARETEPFSFVTTDASEDFCETSFFSSQLAAANPMRAVTARTPATVPVSFFPSFMLRFLSSVSRLNDAQYRKRMLTAC